MSTEPSVYAQCGMRISSEIPLNLPVLQDAQPDLVVRWGPEILDTTGPPPGEVIASYGSGEDRWYTATSTGSGFLMRFRGYGQVALSADMSELEVRRDPAGERDLLPILLAGTVSAFVLTMRGHTVLHASAVEIEGRALTFVGQSGRGKSTLATLLCLDGAKLVTDDVLTVDPGPPVTCIGGASELRLRQPAMILAESRPLAPTRATADERLALTLESSPSSSLPLAAIVVPSPSRTEKEVIIRELSPATAVFWLLAFPRINGWSLPEVLRRDFEVTSAIVNHVPVYDVTVPWGPPFDPAVAKEVAALATG